MDEEIKEQLKTIEFKSIANSGHFNFEIEKLNKAVSTLYEYNENIKKENKLLKEAIVSISKHTGFKNDYINKLSNEIVKENFK
ncbi:hypothetical protein [Staphylococcus phage vB_StaM_PB50]|nr:hypothetical protein [Staphylococcus phage vB_StaM_PB50]